MKRSKVFKPRTSSSNKRYKPKEKEERKERQSLYNTPEWKTYRFRFLHYNKNCYACGVSKDSAKLIVDHVKVHKSDEELFWNVSNFIPLCNRCHNTITSLFDKHTVQRLEDKMKWIENKRRETGTTVKVKVVHRKKVEG